MRINDNLMRLIFDGKELMANIHIKINTEKMKVKS